MRRYTMVCSLKKDFDHDTTPHRLVMTLGEFSIYAEDDLHAMEVFRLHFQHHDYYEVSVIEN